VRSRFSLHSDIVAPYLLKYGTEDQKQSTYHKWPRGMITIGMTEPNCGSDLKALLTTAEDKGDHYVVNGQKNLSLTGTCAIWL
jgi:alkylation response protein AidB-like acyl-CoA dehydrogenase